MWNDRALAFLLPSAMTKQSGSPTSKWLDEQDLSGVLLSCFDCNDFILEALSDSQPDFSPDSASCNVSLLGLSSFKDHQCVADIDRSWYSRWALSMWEASKMQFSWFLAFVRSFSVRPQYHYPGLQDPVFFVFPHLSPTLAIPAERSNSAFVSEAANDQLQLSLVEEIFCGPDIINPLFVSARCLDKQRLILDLRHVNAFIYKRKFKCQTCPWPLRFSIRTTIHLNLIWSYHITILIEIFPKHRKKTPFAWDLGTGRFRYFQFFVLPFGVSSAPFIFTDQDSQTTRLKYPGEVGVFLLPFFWTIA